MLAAGLISCVSLFPVSFHDGPPSLVVNSICCDNFQPKKVNNWAQWSSSTLQSRKQGQQGHVSGKCRRQDSNSEPFDFFSPCPAVKKAKPRVLKQMGQR